MMAASPRAVLIESALMAAFTSCALLGIKGRPMLVAVALVATTTFISGCGDALLSKDASREIAAVRRAVEARPADVNRPTASGELPLAVAMRLRSSSLASWLIARGASAIAVNPNGDPLLYTAVVYDRPAHEVMRALLAHGGFPVDVANRQGATPLHYAASLAQTATLDLLLSSGADVNRRDPSGRTALHVLGEALLPPDPTLKAPDPKSAAAQPAAIAAAMDRLLAAGARLDAADRRGLQPLHHYAWQGNVAAVQAALAHGASVAAVDAAGQTPLFLASAFARVEIVDLLLQAGADAQHRDGHGDTALEAAAHTRPTPAAAAKVAARLTAAAADPSSWSRPR